MSTRLPAWLTVSLDVIAQHRATKEPLNQLVAKVARARGLGSRERQLVGDGVFAWTRVEQLNLGPHVRKRDADLLQLLVALEDNIDVTPLIADLTKELALLFVKVPRQNKKTTWPEWFSRALDDEYGESAPSLMASLLERAAPVLAVDRRLMSVGDAKDLLAQKGVSVRESSLVEGALVVLDEQFAFQRLPAALQRALWLMDEGSQLAAQCVGAQPGHLVLDMCAGGGGKTRYLLQNGARVIGADLSESRLRASMEREGVNDALHVVADGLMPPFKPETFDRILIDAPCSGTGTLRRAPDVLTRLDPKHLDHFVEIQRGLMRQALGLLRPKGKLVYATCSILPQENRQMLDYVTTHLPGLKPALLPGDRGHWVQLLPSLHGSDGFFIACWEKE